MFNVVFNPKNEPSEHTDEEGGKTCRQREGPRRTEGRQRGRRERGEEGRRESETEREGKDERGTYDVHGLRTR